MCVCVSVRVCVCVSVCVRMCTPVSVYMYLSGSKPPALIVLILAVSFEAPLRHFPLRFSCTHTHTHTHIHTHKHTNTHTITHTYTHKSTHAHTRTHAHSHTQVVIDLLFQLYPLKQPLLSRHATEALSALCDSQVSHLSPTTLSQILMVSVLTLSEAHDRGPLCAV